MSVALDVHDEHRRVVDLGDVHLVLVGVREHVRGSDVYRHRLELFLDQRDQPGAILGVGFSNMHVALAAALFLSTSWVRIVQWRLSWYSAPTSLNNVLLNDGFMLERYNKVIDNGHVLQDSLLTDTYTQAFLSGCAKIGDAGSHDHMGMEAGGCDARMGPRSAMRPSA